MRPTFRTIAISAALGIGAILGTGAGEARAQWAGGPGYGPGWYGGHYKVRVRERGFYRPVYGPPVVVATPTVVEETRVIRTAPVVERRIIQAPPIVERRVIQPPPVVESRVVQPPPLVETQVIQPPPVVERGFVTFPY